MFNVISEGEFTIKGTTETKSINRVRNPQPLYQLQTIDNVECRRPQLNPRRFNNFIDILQL